MQLGNELHLIESQVAENGSVTLARFSNAYKFTKIWSYLPVNYVKFLLNPLSATQTSISTSLFSLDVRPYIVLLQLY